MGDGRTWREWVLPFKHRRCNETKEYHRAQQSPHENDWLPGNEDIHGRTSGDEARLTITAIILRKTLDFRGHLARVSSLRSCKREEQQRQERRVAPRPHRRPFSRDIKITVAHL